VNYLWFAEKEIAARLRGYKTCKYAINSRAVGWRIKTNERIVGYACLESAIRFVIFPKLIFRTWLPAIDAKHHSFAKHSSRNNRKF
jgi:hypothetical protein